MLPSATLIVTSPAVRPLVSVVITVWAMTGCAARAKPLARLVMTKPRREKSVCATRLFTCDSKLSMNPLPSLHLVGAAKHIPGGEPDEAPQPHDGTAHREVITPAPAAAARSGAVPWRGCRRRPSSTS